MATSFSYAEERERGPQRIEREAWVAGLFLNVSHEWNNMGKQDFSCQMWLEQGGGGREGIVCPLAICPPPPPPPIPFPFLPTPPPPPPPPTEAQR